MWGDLKWALGKLEITRPLHHGWDFGVSLDLNNFVRSPPLASN
jgi:hypothetical protein